MLFNSDSFDVYETDDVPETVRNVFPHEEVNDPDHIELVNIDFEAAKERFKGRTLNITGVDFSDTLAQKRRHAYGSSAYTLEIVGGAYPAHETSEQKFNRLTYEINELSDMLRNETDEANSFVTPANCALLMDELNGVRVGQAAASCAPPRTSGSVTQSESASSLQSAAVSAPPNHAVIALEQRLRKIESLVGTLPSSSTSLVDSLGDLKFRTEALNPVYLGALEIRLNTILAKLDKVEGDGTGEAAVERKVNNLLTLMTKWDAVCDTLPSNVKKLQSLSKLHEQSQHFSDRLSELIGIRQHVEKAITRDRDDLRDLQLKTKEDVAAISKQIASLQKRLEGLEM